MANFADLLKKIANNARLTPRELDELGRFGVETQQRNTFIAGNTTPQNTINVTLPFLPVFHEIFQSAKSVIEFDVPPSCNHLMIIGSGRIDQNASGSVWIQYNRDYGNNYYYENIRTDGTTVTTALNTAQSKGFIGSFAVSVYAAGIVGSFVTFVLNCQSSFNKTTLSNSSNNGYSYLFNHGAEWRSTSRIGHIEIFATDGTGTKGSANITAGSVLTVYGMI